MAKISDGEASHLELISQLITNFPACMGRLADSGIVAVGERAAEIKRQLGDLTYDSDEIVYDSCGWNGGVFVDGAKRSYAPEGAPVGHAIFNTPGDRFRSCGTIEDWLEKVAAPLAGQLVAEFCFGVMFAGILTSFTGFTVNPGLSLVGDTEDGKSLILILASSACGPPTSDNTGDGYLLSLSGTGNGIEEEMQNYVDMTMIFDEATAFGYGLSEKERGRAFIDVVYMLGNGKEKKRRGEHARHFNFCYITSSNNEASDIIRGADTQEVVKAINSRLNSINLKGRPNGVLDRLPPGLFNKGDFLGDLLTQAQRNYGVAMPHLLKQLVDRVASDPDAFKELVLEHITDFRDVATLGWPQKASKRVLDNFGLIYAASSLAQHYGALPASFSPMDSTLACYRLHLASSLPPPRPVEIVAALLDDPEVEHLDRGQRLDITVEQFAALKAVKVVSPKYTELIMTANAADRLFGGWSRAVRKDPDIARIHKREGGRPDTYRNIRAADRDRVVCFRIKPDWPFRRQLEPVS
ncbi:DUF927 domain-containing protein [Sphingomonas sp.]|uniref:DUF927 domain-containing protein n=1 Tax=Sphingomonas sp. TaxID=28214 RepID=UPI003AFFBBCD